MNAFSFVSKLFNRFVNMGFSIKELKILDKPSNQPGHYNSRDLINNGVWNSNRLLDVSIFVVKFSLFLVYATLCL